MAQRPGRVGLPGTVRAIARDRAERPACEVEFDATACEGIRLVRQHGQGNVAPGEFVEQLRDTVVGAGSDVPAFVVGVKKPQYAVLDLVVGVRVRWQGAMKEHPYAAANELFVRLVRMGWKARFRQDAVRRGRDVA